VCAYSAIDLADPLPLTSAQGHSADSCTFRRMSALGPQPDMRIVIAQEFERGARFSDGIARWRPAACRQAVKAMFGPRSKYSIWPAVREPPSSTRAAPTQGWKWFN